MRMFLAYLCGILSVLFMGAVVKLSPGAAIEYLRHFRDVLDSLELAMSQNDMMETMGIARTRTGAEMEAEWDAAEEWREVGK